MDPKRTALVLIEYQNDFTSKGGTLHDAVKGVMEKKSMWTGRVKFREILESGGVKDRVALGYVSAEEFDRLVRPETMLAPAVPKAP